MKKFKRIACIFGIILVLATLVSGIAVFATDSALDVGGISIDVGDDSAGIADSLQVVFLLTILAVAPAILIMMTGFTRIVIVLSFVKNALGLQQTPPNQVMIGLAVFLTFFLMSPIFNQINEEAYIPYTENQITQEVAVERALAPMREFMLKQTKAADLNMFLDIAGEETPATTDEIPTEVIISAFVTSELKTAFIMGFIIYIPFLVIDMIVASTLMSLGMMMLPPTMISLPFKILLFILVDGWTLTVKTLLTSFS